MIATTPSQIAEEHSQLFDHGASMLERIFTTANVGIALLNPHGTLVIANDYAMRLFRITPEELPRTRYLDYVRPEERNDAARTLTDLLTRKTDIVDIERRYRRPDGSEFWGHLVAEPCLGKDKRLLGILAVLTDITDHRAVENALRERMKERQCLYEIFAQTEDLDQPLDVQFRRVTALICQAWQWPELAAACIEWQGQRYSTPHFTPTPWMMSVQGWTDQALAVDLHIAYESMPATDEAIFPTEERTLADTIVHRLADVINRRHAARLVTERERERELRASRLQLHTRLLGWLSTCEAGMDGDISRLAFELTEVLSATLDIPRVSVWIMDKNETQLTCLNLYETSSQDHSDGQLILEESFRNEMQALKSSRYVATSSPCTDPRTAGYTQSYLIPNDITAMLDCVVVCGGRNRGVVCFEYVGQPHQWQPDEISFGCQVADQIGMAMLNKDRLDAAQVLHWDARVRQTLERLYRSIMHDAPSLAAISNAILDEAKKLTECPDGYVGTIGEDNALVVHARTSMAGCAIPPNQRQVVFFPDAHGNYPGLWGHSLNTRQSFLTNTPRLHPARKGVPVGHLEIRSLLSVPVLLGDALTGQISLGNKPGGFTRRDQDALAQIADFYALAIQHAQSEEALVNSKLLLENILHGISAGIIIIDPKTLRIEAANEVVQTMLRARPEDLIGQPCSTLTWEDEAGEEIRHCMARTQPIVHREFRVRRLNGNAIPVSKTIIEARIGGAPKLVEIIFDISDQKNMERQLALAQKMESIGQLAAGIAHEINTPAQYLTDNLRFVSEGFASLVTRLRTAREQGTARDCAALWAEHDVEFLLTEIPQALEQSLEGVGRITTIVQAMKRFSHPGSEQREQVNVNEALRTTALVSRNEWKYHAELVMDLDQDLPFISGFGGDLNQVFLNVLVNAAHAVEAKIQGSATKGTVTISTRATNTHVEIRFTDTGCGIASENLHRVFDPFFTTKPVGKGTGQGLAISYQIVVIKHAGTIEFHSAPGEGTQCVITLPIAPEGAPHV